MDNDNRAKRIAASWRIMAQRYWKAVDVARRESGHNAPHLLWSLQCPHGLIISLSSECPACAAARIRDLEGENRALKRALKLTRCCRVRAHKD